MRNQEEFISGTYTQGHHYRSFLPTGIFEASRHWHTSEIDLLLEEASRLLGELNAYSNLIPDVDFFIRMHTFKEATASSAIEGTRTEFGEALLDEDEVDPERRDDWLEVQNYTKAMNYALERLGVLPLTMRLLNETHRILMSGARGENRAPGEVRRSQNWIGGATLKDAFFVPPPADKVPDLLSDLEKFWHDETLPIPHLIKIGLSHYQFETIHPYLDGNGRVGRLLITLYLVDKGILRKPVLYLSDFFERNRSSYYDSLTMVRTRNDIGHWIKFFMVGVQQTAENSRRTFEAIVSLRSESERRVMQMGKRSKNALLLLDRLYSKPIVTPRNIAAMLEITPQSANSLAKAFEKAGILREMTGYKRNRLFIFQEYVDIFSRRT